MIGTGGFITDTWKMIKVDDNEVIKSGYDGNVEIGTMVTRRRRELVESDVPEH